MFHFNMVPHDRPAVRGRVAHLAHVQGLLRVRVARSDGVLKCDLHLSCRVKYRMDINDTSRMQLST